MNNSIPGSTIVGYPPRRYVRGLLIALLTALTALPAAKPQVVLQGGFVTPRSDLTADEGLVWRGRLWITHQLTDRLDWSFFGDYTPVTMLWLYSGKVSYRLTTNWSVALGRQTFWNSLHSARFDGLSLDKKAGTTGSYRQLKFYAGVIPDTEIATGYSQSGQPVFGGSLGLTRGRSNYGVQIWGNYLRDELQYYLGGTARLNIGRRLLQTADLALNLAQATPDKIRLRTVYRLSPLVSVNLQYRYAGSATVSPYPWVEDGEFDPRQVVSMGGSLNLAGKLLVRLSFSQRLGSNQSQYFITRLSWKWLTFSWRLNSQSLYEGSYAQLGAQMRLWGKLKLGGSVGAGSYSRFDDDSEAVAAMAAQNAQVTRESTEQSTLALTAWVQNSGPGRLGYRLFTQYTQNRFFESDGRLGLQVTYAL
ncbi:MAG: hypothetical protein V3W14_07390 [Candidatus Neomarinimicrobiota bacterium]